MLHLVDDEHNVGLRLVHDLGQHLGERDPAVDAQRLDPEPEPEACDGQVRIAQLLQPLQHRAGGRLQIAQRLANGAMDQRRRVGLRIRPEVDVDDQGASSLQGRHQVCLQERRLAGSAQTRDEQA
jgi:hypothetical protein